VTFWLFPLHSARFFLRLDELSTFFRNGFGFRCGIQVFRLLVSAYSVFTTIDTQAIKAFPYSRYIMRTYLFTSRERKAIRAFLAKKIKPSDGSIRMILSRVRAFKDLPNDVELYLRLREAVSTKSA
jgi:hypothetical protein